MKRKILCAAAAAVILIAYFIFLFLYTKKDYNGAPSISFDTGHIELSVQDDAGALLEGVTASDPEDGDLTDQVLIDSISVFDDQGRRTVRYVVFDSENTPAQAERTLSYTDYTPPVIGLTGSLVVDNLSDVELNRLGSATSCVDGDISNRLNVKIGTLQEDSVRLDFSVTDSTGTEASLSVSCDYDRSVYLADIVLGNYLLYLPAGETYDLKSNIRDIIISKQSRMELLDEVEIQSGVDFSKPGTYEVYYYLASDTGSSGRAKGIVVIQ